MRARTNGRPITTIGRAQISASPKLSGEEWEMILVAARYRGSPHTYSLSRRHWSKVLCPIWIAFALVLGATGIGVDRTSEFRLRFHLGPSGFEMRTDEDVGCLPLFHPRFEIVEIVDGECACAAI